MARKKIIRSTSDAYHIYARSNNKEAFPLPTHQCWGIFNFYLDELIKRYDFEVHAFVLMNNHFHAIVSTPRGNIDEGMRYFMTQTSKGMGLASERINHVYGGPYGWTLINSPTVYAVMLKYVYRNPIKAKLVTNVEQYFWSTFKSGNYKFEVTPNANFEGMLPKNKNDLRDWLNQPTPPELESNIKECFSRNGEFKIGKNKSRYKLDLEKYLERK